ncbi:uncharacterized protein TRIADDRAFT_56112 [Trichoplax adhaerens]|uniref:Uncharacterized protein n=1 Tax=Trichoplax adhaerens TaxID=10228 RepID=B3RX78_TRIAD|nr:predicted protein [Trichoplax adhaerens]EDV24823.1 predicted protein [Trichoplax adhaerens]|eukprot:XP_002112713.1 predicted protein [Trichoplax adhaerens]
MDRNDRNDCMQRLAFLWNCSHASLRHSTQLSGFYIYRIKQLASQFGIDYSSSANELKTPTSSHNRNSSIAVSSISKSAKKRSMIRHSLLTSMLKASAASTPQSSPSLKDFLMST